jgi:hypothetical protein
VRARGASHRALSVPSSCAGDAVRVRSTGIDTLNLTARGKLRDEAVELVAGRQSEARVSEEPQLVEFPITSQAFMVKPFGWRGYTYWLSSPDFELMLGKSEKFPAVVVQLHSAYLHSMGVDRGLDLMEGLLRHEILAGAYDLAVSRIDIYADVQGWELRLADLDRFVSFGRHRRGFQENQQAFAVGSRLSGFMIGRDALVARLYDKTAEIQKRGLGWLPDLWGTDGRDQAVWRLEFQYRRAALAEFNLKRVDDVVASVQDLWRYATEVWLSLRLPTRHSLTRRWPVDPLWEEIRRIRIAPSTTGVVRRRLEEADELRLVQGLQGYVSSLAARRDRMDLDDAMEDFGTVLRRYLDSRGRQFASEVRRKQARHLGVTAFLEDET